MCEIIGSVLVAAVVVGVVASASGVALLLSSILI